jgi:hypothetical protein
MSLIYWTTIMGYGDTELYTEAEEDVLELTAGDS